jgi:hypothetical protein
MSLLTPDRTNPSGSQSNRLKQDDEIRGYVSKGTRIAFGLVIAGILLAVVFKSFFSVNNHEVVALTYPTGHVQFFTSPGIYAQWLGHVTEFEKRQKYDFEETIQFSDGAHAKISGSVQYQMPLDNPSLNKIYALYPSPEAIQKGLIETNLQKAVYLTGRMMSSKESYAERRGDLLSYMEDQLAHGPYQTRTHAVEIPDTLDDTKTRSVTVTEVAVNAAGQQMRQEQGVFEQFGVGTSNFNFKVEYDPQVEAQIQQQQQLAQAINTSIAEAKQAEQRAITAAKNGEANAAQAKWEQEKNNASQQAANEQLVRNAELNRKRAEFDKAALILEGEGEAQKRQLIMSADGALDKKLQTYTEAQRLWADAFKNYQGAIVPSIVSGGGSQGNGAVNFMEMLGAKAAKDLSLDLSVPSGKQTGGGRGK